jgi:alpha-ribazole phosphatase/probable phosphoglycerate mutase
MATIIYLIRHGEVRDGNEKRYNGHIDVPLSGRGKEQMSRLSNYLRDVSRLKAVYTSDLSRAIESGEIIAEPHGVKPVREKGLKEFSFGAWEGMTFNEIELKYPDAFKAWAKNPVKFSPVKGESTLDVRNRAIPVFHDIIRKHDEGEIAIVTHGGINRIILCEILGMPLENIFRIEQNFAALNIIEKWDYPLVKLMNFII